MQAAKHTHPIEKSVVLVGAGNAHLQFVKRWGMRPVRGVAVTLVNEATTIPYSAMVPGHIAGDSASRSELVVPLLRGDELIGVFDIDSPQVGRFDADDQAGLEAIARVFVEALG